jgi:hypothetical protein
MNGKVPVRQWCVKPLSQYVANQALPDIANIQALVSIYVV